MPTFYVIKSLNDLGESVMLANFLGDDPADAWNADNTSAMRHTHHDEAKAALAWFYKRCLELGAKNLAGTFERAVVCRDTNPPSENPRKRGLGSTPNNGEEGVDAEGRRYVVCGIHAPSLVEWCMAGGGYHLRAGLPAMANVLVATWELPAWVANAMLTRRMPYAIDGDTVVIEY
ncbi:hypothetical protein BF49_4648 [Bradyrhizobium sp.]|uniref:hypothetical protein n=1 Tax=Bradyrhizobium sp. TaxID=376 RepID=UPI0007C1D391|nr:hypothetical protein [Bradyrhizobium sp.]CUT13568.1 hypothetical protein BF49_4648 [Bradyrhizobium sp.]